MSINAKKSAPKIAPSAAGSGRVLGMTTPQSIAMQTIVHERLDELNPSPFEDVYDRVDSVLLNLSLLGEVTESDLRNYFTSAGLNLTDWTTFSTASDLTSVYVSAGIIQLTDMFYPGLLDLDSNLVKHSLVDEDFATQLEKVKTDSIFFRDFVIPSVVS